MLSLKKRDKTKGKGLVKQGGRKTQDCRMGGKKKDAYTTQNADKKRKKSVDGAEKKGENIWGRSRRINIFSQYTDAEARVSKKKHKGRQKRKKLLR